MGVVTAVLIGFFAFIMMRVSEPTLAPLFILILSFEDSIQITKLLEAQNVKHEIRQEGAVILAPKDQDPALAHAAGRKWSASRRQRRL